MTTLTPAAKVAKFLAFLKIEKLSMSKFARLIDVNMMTVWRYTKKDKKNKKYRDPDSDVKEKMRTMAGYDYDAGSKIH